MHISTRPGGVTLLELMIVIALIGITLMIGVPSFQSIINSSRVTAPANDLLAAIQSARLESVRTGRRTVICRSDNPDAPTPACVAAGATWTGWAAFEDADGDGTLDAGERLLRAGAVEPPAQLLVSSNISGASNRIVIRPDGMARTGAGALLAARLRVCVPETRPAENSRDVVITAGSRMAVERASLAGACPAPGN